MEKENAALKLMGKEIEASFKAIGVARISSDLVVVIANKEKDAAVKHLKELQQAYDLVCSSKLVVVEDNRVLSE